jgi:Pyridoxamine 5'-phosphate oxidase
MEQELGRLGDVAAPYRSRDERRTLAARRLSSERDCWLVTCDADHGPYVVPISFLVVATDVYLATNQHRPTVRNVRAESRVLLVLPGHGDAVWAQGLCVVLELDQVEPTVMRRYVDKAGWSPVEAGQDFVMLRVSLSNLLCSRSPAEDADRVVWRAGDPVAW